MVRSVELCVLRASLVVTPLACRDMYIMSRVVQTLTKSARASRIEKLYIVLTATKRSLSGPVLDASYLSHGPLLQMFTPFKFARIRALVCAFCRSALQFFYV